MRDHLNRFPNSAATQGHWTVRWVVGGRCEVDVPLRRRQSLRTASEWQAWDLGVCRVVGGGGHKVCDSL